MDINQAFFITPLFFLAALLFSSVGHGGASAYLAVMALLGLAPESMRPAALLLNVLVASIGFYKFYRAKAFDWQLFWPLAIMSVPLAFIGGQMHLPPQYYKSLVGAVLVFAAMQIFLKAQANTLQANIHAPPRPVLFCLGAGLGLLSGLTGIGGGIFLSPVLLLLNWAEPRIISGVAAAFILANSVSGLAGVLAKQSVLSVHLGYWAVAVVLGGLIGAEYGSKRLTSPSIRKLLALVVFFAGGKMLWEGWMLLA